MKQATSKKDSDAVLDHILFGRALPPNLSKSPAGQIIPSKQETEAEKRKKENDEITKRAYEKLSKAPLLAVCHSHICKCGNSWQSFGFYARRVTEPVLGVGHPTFTKALDYDPAPERPTATEWIEIKEQYCIKCYFPK